MYEQEVIFQNICDFEHGFGVFKYLRLGHRDHDRRYRFIKTFMFYLKHFYIIKKIENIRKQIVVLIEFHCSKNNSNLDFTILCFGKIISPTTKLRSYLFYKFDLNVYSIYVILCFFFMFVLSFSILMNTNKQIQK